MKLFGYPLELIILDVDGVLLNVLKCFYIHFRTIAAKIGLDLNLLESYLEKSRTGKRQTGTRFSGLMKEIWPQISHEQIELFRTALVVEEDKSPYDEIPGSVETISWLRDNGIKLALCTNNSLHDLANRKFPPIGLDLNIFIAAGTSDTGYFKPEPKILDHVLERVSVKRKHMVFVGDWYPDMEVARKRDIRFIAVTSGGTPRSAFLREGVAEDHILEKLSDLQKIVEL